ncbi:hypothetical protein [Streptomyces xiaopingdaonensis]|uniref:hypothetical protein n=1 Tax=Streptomyces xiaopingdaonensis TaxID=1565415 RepID=UPI0012FF07EE|nr:hypothetical protein [Streptomyces xiaopingdaonensis]
MGKSEARALAEDVIESAVVSHGGKISPGFDNLFFYRCVGERYELAEDGRFSMSYYGRTEVSPESQAAAMRQIRRALARRGFHVERDVPPEVAREISLQAEGPHRFSVSVESDENEGVVRFSLQTPCLLPPGVKQEEF